MSGHTSTTAALVVTEPGDGDVLQVQDREIPDPGPGELLVEVAASGVNFIEVYQRQGVYPMPTPFVLGAEGAGRVAAIGPDVHGVAVGDVVAWAAGPGSHAGLVIVAADKAVPVPAGLDPELAAAVMLQGMTAHYLVNSTYPVQPGDSVLVHAAAGGVGQLLIQLAKAHGARVIGTVSTEAKAEKVRALGADVVIRYSDFADAHALADAIRDANGGHGRQRGVRRRRAGHVRGIAGRAGPARDGRAVRRGERAGAAVRPAAAQPARRAVRHPTLVGPLHGHP